MSASSSQTGFTVVELLVTLVVVAIFLFAGYQLYAVVIRSGADVTQLNRSANIGYSQLRRHAASASNPCTPSTPFNGTEGEFQITVTVSCPFGSSSSTSKVTSTVTYGPASAQTTTTQAEYVYKK